MTDRELASVSAACCGTTCCSPKPKEISHEPFGVFRLRPAEESDRGAVSVLLSEAKLAGLDAGSQFGSQYVVACDNNNQLVGVAGLEIYGTDALLRSVAVAPAFRSQGLGRQLTQDRLQWAAKQGISNVYLLTADAGGYWSRHGFSEIQRADAPPSIRATSQWSGGCSSSATAMKKQLTDSQ